MWPRHELDIMPYKSSKMYQFVCCFNLWQCGFLQEQKICKQINSLPTDDWAWPPKSACQPWLPTSGPCAPDSSAGLSFLKNKVFLRPARFVVLTCDLLHNVPLSQSLSIVQSSAPCLTAVWSWATTASLVLPRPAEDFMHMKYWSWTTGDITGNILFLPHLPQVRHR